MFAEHLHLQSKDGGHESLQCMDLQFPGMREMHREVDTIPVENVGCNVPSLEGRVGTSKNFPDI